MTKQQTEIINLLRERKEPMTKSELVEEFGHWYHSNASKWLGDILSRMVNSGLLHRPKRGYYALGSDISESNQMTLF